MIQPKRTKRTDEEWDALVTEFKASGLTQAAFCEQRGVSAYSLHRRLWAGTSTSSAGAPSAMATNNSASLNSWN